MMLANERVRASLPAKPPSGTVSAAGSVGSPGRAAAGSPRRMASRYSVQACTKPRICWSKLSSAETKVASVPACVTLPAERPCVVPVAAHWAENAACHESSSESLVLYQSAMGHRSWKGCPVVYTRDAPPEMQNAECRMQNEGNAARATGARASATYDQASAARDQASATYDQASAAKASASATRD